MNNPFDPVEYHTEWTAYEKARQDAIKTVEGVPNPHNIDNFNGMRYYAFEGARDKIIEALKEE